MAYKKSLYKSKPAHFLYGSYVTTLFCTLQELFFHNRLGRLSAGGAASVAAPIAFIVIMNTAVHAANLIFCLAAAADCTSICHGQYGFCAAVAGLQYDLSTLHIIVAYTVSRNEVMVFFFAAGSTNMVLLARVVQVGYFCACRLKTIHSRFMKSVILKSAD